MTCRFWPLVALALAGCDFGRAEMWKDKFVNEVNQHYQTQQIRNAEIAAREMEIENNKVFIGILNDRIQTLDKENGALKKRVGELEKKLSESGPTSVPRKPLRAKVTAVANDVHVVVISVGEVDGVRLGEEFWILRGTRRISKGFVDRVDARWAALKLADPLAEARVADDATNEADPK